MSYYASNYYQNPGPYYAGSDYDAPVPTSPAPRALGSGRSIPAS
jgi:hypothetical protein